MHRGGDEGLDTVRGGLGSVGLPPGMGVGYLGTTRLPSSLALSHPRGSCHNNQAPFTDPL